MPGKGFSPLASTGYAVDPVSFSGHDMIRQEKALEQRRKQHQAVDQYLSLIDELTDDRGEIARLAMKRFVDRVCVLISEDKECQVYVNLFNDMRLTINTGKAVAELFYPTES